MCYAGGPYCYKKYARNFGKSIARYEEAESELNRVKREQRELSLKEKSGSLTTEEVKNKRHQLDTETAKIQQKFDDAKAARVKAENELLIQSPEGVELLDAHRLRAEITSAYALEAERDFVEGHLKDKMREHENRYYRETLKKHFGKDAPITQDNQQGFNFNADEKTVTFSHRNKTEPLFTETAKPLYSAEDVERLRNENGSHRVIYKDEDENYRTATLISDGFGRMSIVPDQKTGHDDSMIEVSSENFSSLRMRPTDAPGHSYNPHVNRADYWDKSSNSSDANRAKAAKVWEAYSQRNESKKERELRAKRFNVGYNAVIAKNRFQKETAKSRGTLSKAIQDAKAGRLSKEQLLRVRSKEKKKLEGFRSDSISAHMMNQQMIHSWVMVPQGKFDLEENIEGKISDALK